MPENKITDIALNDAKPFIINNIQEQIRCLKDNEHCSVLLLSGPPGIGKSDIMEQIAKELNCGLNPQYLGTMLVEQFGMPLPTTDPNADFQKWSKPDFYSTNNLRVKLHYTNPSCKCEGSYSANYDDPPFVILFMDDIHLAPKTIQTYFFQLLTYRSIHNKKMPANFVMIGAGNRSLDRAGAQPFLAPITNRFYFLDVTANADDWIRNFAIPKHIRQDIISFISLYPELLMSEPLESKAWASPRSWTYFSQEMNQMQKSRPLDISTMTTIGKGHIGIDYTTKFIEYVTLYMRWNAEQYFNGVPLPNLKNNSKIENYTLMSALTAELQKNLRTNKWNLQDEETKKQIKVIKSLFDDMIDLCPEIVPLGLRSLILSESITTNEAKLYYELTTSNPKLLGALKEILSTKTK